MNSFNFTVGRTMWVWLSGKWHSQWVMSPRSPKGVHIYLQLFAKTWFFVCVGCLYGLKVFSLLCPEIPPIRGNSFSLKGLWFYSKWRWNSLKSVRKWECQHLWSLHTTAVRWGVPSEWLVHRKETEGWAELPGGGSRAWGRQRTHMVVAGSRNSIIWTRVRGRQAEERCPEKQGIMRPMVARIRCRGSKVLTRVPARDGAEVRLSPCSGAALLTCGALYTLD